MIKIEDLEQAGATPELIVKIMKLAQERETLEDDLRRLRRERNERYRLNRLKASQPSQIVLLDAKEGSLGSPEVPPKEYISNPSPNLLSSKKSTNGKDDASEFEMWWLRYPEKIGKAKARIAFKTALARADFRTLYEGIGRYITAKPPDRSWCHPATWLNQDRWLDCPAIPPSGGKVVGFVGAQPKSPTSPEGIAARERYLSAQRERDRENPNPLTRTQGVGMFRSLAESLIVPPEPELKRPNGNGDWPVLEDKK